MSFLNPVNEPVLRFSSTDADAPQIDYNARVAGDVKAVLKACLVTGYGATASAGWSIFNEVDHVAEFVSPSAAMSDYRLGIDDTSTSSTTWYYQYKSSRVNPSYNNPTKAFTNINKAHASNGWQLLATERGFIFIELVYATQVGDLSARITYFSQVKSGLIDSAGANMMFFNIGHNATISSPVQLYSKDYPHFMLGSYTSTRIISATPFAVPVTEYQTGLSSMDVASELYVASPTANVALGKIPAILTKVVNNIDDMYGVRDTVIDGIPVVSVCCGISYASTAPAMYSYGRTFLIRTDYWGY